MRIFTTMRGDFVQRYEYTIKSNTPTDTRLGMYLWRLITQGRPEKENKKSVTELPLILGVLVKSATNFTVQKLASEAGWRDQGAMQHLILQRYFFENDPFFVGMEVPVWTNEVLGHIDLIRIEDGRLQIWDLKPNAAKEKKAASQLSRYRDLLALAIQIDPAEIQAFYFDDIDIFEIPHQQAIQPN